MIVVVDLKFLIGLILLGIVSILWVVFKLLERRKSK